MGYIPTMNFGTWYRSLTREEREQFALRASTSREYIEIHLLPRRKNPRKDTMERLAKASLGEITFHQVVEYFLMSDAA